MEKLTITKPFTVDTLVGVVGAMRGDFVLKDDKGMERARAPFTGTGGSTAPISVPLPESITLEPGTYFVGFELPQTRDENVHRWGVVHVNGNRIETRPSLGMYTVLRHPEPGEIIVDHRNVCRVARRRDRKALHYVLHVR